MSKNFSFLHTCMKGGGGEEGGEGEGQRGGKDAFFLALSFPR